MRHTDVSKHPKPGDTISASLLGYRSRHLMIWNICHKCGNYRWVLNTRSERKRGCRSCSNKVFLEPRLYRRLKTISANDAPREGDVIRGNEINKSDRLYQWVVCPDCSIARWVIRSTVSLYKKCSECGNKTKKTYIGEESSQWKGGRIISKQGYVYIIVREDSLYASMRNFIGYVAEHRLVMAKKLNRCLWRWEIVHHKHSKYPKGSIEDKQDNRTENLELMPTKYDHYAITIWERQVSELKQKVVDLEKKARLNEWRIKELESGRKKDEVL